jgi:hypothetical protein
MENRLHIFEHNQAVYSSGVEQPLILALKSRRPETALELLERAANPNIITRSSWYHFNSYSHFTGSALDLAQRQLEVLRDYQRNRAPGPSPPELPEGIDSFLDNFEEGTYQHWVVSQDIERIRGSYQINLRGYEKQKAAHESASGEKEKASAIEKATKKVETVYKALLAKGAKTMSEIDPRPQDKGQGSGIPNPYHRALIQKKETYNYTFSFRNVNDVTEARREAYIKL